MTNWLVLFFFSVKENSGLMTVKLNRLKTPVEQHFLLSIISESAQDLRKLGKKIPGGSTVI